VSVEEIRVERVDVAQARLDDLAERLERARWAQEIPDTGWDYGVPTDELREQVAYWQDHYDWRRWEARLNDYPQYSTLIDGQKIHFLHVRSPDPTALPLILTHGWPGSVFEFLELIAPLTDPVGSGRDITQAFHLIIPSLPGFAFSGPTRDRGWDLNRIAEAWFTLMSRLGYDRFGAAGNDWGSSISLALGRLHPDQVLGAHVTQVFAEPESDTEAAGLTERERADRAWYEQTMSAYDVLQSQQPQTVAHAFADSPVGLLGWLNQIYRGGYHLDFILSNLLSYWFTDTVASSMRLYYEASRTGRRQKTNIPVAVSQFANDYLTIRSLAVQDHPGLHTFTEHAHGNHFAAHSAPLTVVEDLQTFFSALRRASGHSQLGSEKGPGLSISGPAGSSSS
jgi:pimeloyl-ACP methyl ester carboxylesterase